MWQITALFFPQNNGTLHVMLCYFSILLSLPRLDWGAAEKALHCDCESCSVWVHLNSIFFYELKYLYTLLLNNDTQAFWFMCILIKGYWGLNNHD